MHALRPYQKECLSRLLSAHKSGLRRALVSLPTGTGKTVIFASFPTAFRMRKKLLILAHREELIEQAAEKLRLAVPDVEVGIEQGPRRSSPTAKVIVGSVPTLGRSGSKRLATLDPDEFSIVVVDEAHHAVARTYRAILEHFHVFDKGDRFLVGFTATPRRGDGEALGTVFEDVVYSRGIEEMVRGGWLCPITGWRLRTDVDLHGVGIRHGDFIESQLAGAVNVDQRNRLVVEAYKRYANGRRAIVFCVDVAHTRAMAEAFSRLGVASGAVWGAMAPDDRRERLRDLRDGTTRVVTNCQVLTEGFDEPRVDCVIMARPTKSRLLYTQMIGRGTRVHEGKENLVVIDVVDNSQEHSLAGLYELFDLPETLDLNGTPVLAAADSLREIADQCPWINLGELRTGADLWLVRSAMHGVDGAARILAERIHFFSFEPPEEVRYVTALAWHSGPGGDYVLNLANHESLTISRTLLGGWELVLKGRKCQRIGRNDSLEELVLRGDDWVQKYRRDSLRLVELAADWRDLPPTPIQLDRIRKARVPAPQELTRGQASWIISHLTSARRA